MSFVPGSSRNPTGPRQIQGTKPGVLDSTQPARLLRTPGSTLSFAAFDPLTASGGGGSHARKRYDPEPARPKRIVIETPPCGRGQSRWRFVPRARRAPGVEDEGVWPRRVMICGEPYICSEDQWDIYKLDPAYDCYIPQWPGDPQITRKEPQPQESLYSAEDTRKRRPSTSLDTDGETSPKMHKKFRKVVSLVTDEEGTELESATESDDEDEVEEIVAEEFATGTHQSYGTKPTKDRRKESKRKEQREKLKANMTSSSFESRRSKTPDIVDLTMEDDSPPLETTTNGAPPGMPKRKVFLFEDPLGEDSHRPSKKPRTQQPSSRSAFHRKRSERERQRTAQSEFRERMKEFREQQLWEDIFADAPKTTPFGSQSSSDSSVDTENVNGTHTATSADQPLDEEEARRLAAIEESRRKLAELERDRPVWEAEARKRAAQEKEEEEKRRARRAEEERRAAAAAAEEQRKRQRAEAAAAEAERRARAEKERIARELEARRRRERERWSWGPWTTARAIERYKTLSEEFDAAKFTPQNPVMFETIPWPVLQSPVTLRVEDIDWSSVEDFFAAARRHMRAQDYKVLVEKSHKRFHPDRWRARGVLKSVEDEELRGCWEVAANTVAQALTPIWREIRG
ncbi:hypothetical protein GY45DRAFT_1279844 [Cubamyces sp. BRFM 1775]|nr:hypothetical protein GY45DRAFT_1279844 [Cubamyces sp. BRFM 1775]